MGLYDGSDQLFPVDQPPKYEINTSTRDLKFNIHGSANMTYKIWPGFVGCIEFIDTDMCGTDTQKKDMVVYGKALEFTFGFDC